MSELPGKTISSNKSFKRRQYVKNKSTFCKSTNERPQSPRAKYVWTH